MNRSVSRRKVICCVGTVTVMGLAGCGTDEIDKSDESEKESEVEASEFLKRVSVDNTTCTALNGGGCRLRVTFTEYGLSEDAGVARVVFVREGAEQDSAPVPTVSDSVVLKRGFGVSEGEIVLVDSEGREVERVAFELFG